MLLNKANGFLNIHTCVRWSIFLLKNHKVVWETNDLIQNNGFANEKDNVIYEKMNTCFADKDLSSWTGLGRSGHVRSQSFGPIWHVSGPKMIF